VLLKLQVSAMQRRPGADPMLSEIAAGLDTALAELRDLARGLYPPLLESDGLAGALPDAAGRAPIPATVDADGIGRYRPELEAAVYFCCLEALQNAAKHAGPGATAQIGIRADDRALEFTVTDNGAGFDSARVNGSSGLQNMADRIGALGGELRIESSPGLGTTVSGRVPVR
jgi:signal transduction histidine kinase